ncbi:hypothetical protein [Scytonema sp. NUACC26]|uniref:hypothetical protein n=1 Tax=Scytonema sp. NUACC26 TaxID=3140176 RepID=UPI0034DBA3AE
MQSIAFSIELFVVIFSVLCWLVTPETASAIDNISVSRMESEAVPPSIEQLLPTASLQHPVEDDTVLLSSVAPESLSLSDRLTPGHIKQDYYNAIIEDLNLKQARDIASILRKRGVIDQSTKLSGKGIGRTYLVFLIQDHLPAHQEEVKKALSEVLNRELP